MTAPGWVRIPDPLLRRSAPPPACTPRAATTGSCSRGTRPTATSRRPRRRCSTSAPRSRATWSRSFAASASASSGAVLDGVSAEFRAGTLTAVVGRSGSGKTTLLHLLAGLDQPSGGQVVVAGREIEALDRAGAAAVRREQVALITQEPGLVPHLSARENVELGLIVRGLDGDPACGADRGRPRRPPRPPRRPPLRRRAPARRDRARARRRAEAPARRRADRPPRPVERARRRGAPPPPRPRARHGGGVRDPRCGRDRAGRFDDVRELTP